MTPPLVDPTLDARLAAFCADGVAFFESFDLTVREREFHPFVAADYDLVLATLRRVFRPGLSFLEWGSASGIITIVADMLGYEAFGIELDESLVDTARELATRNHSKARFVAGSFLPNGFHWHSHHGDQRTGTIGEGPSGYLALGRALDDFDVVYGYPWAGEEPLMLDLMRQYGRRDALLLLNDVTSGVRAYRGGREVILASE